MTLKELTSDGNIYHLQAPEGVLLPYITYFKVSDVVDPFTTGYGYRNTLIQFNCHAATDLQAQSMADQLADAMRTLAGNPGAGLIVYGQTVKHVLPQSYSITMGEGLGDNGNDCYLAFFEVVVGFTH